MPEDERKKLKILLNHWVEHNSEHAQEFREWAKRARSLGQAEVHDDIIQAARQMDKAKEFLLRALERLKEG